MKKNSVLSFFVCLALAGSSFAAGVTDEKGYSLKNTDSGSKCFDEHTHLIGVTTGIGGITTYYAPHGGITNRYPSICLSYEQPWNKKIGPGYLGVGALVGYRHAGYRYNDPYNAYYYTHSWNDVMVLGRATYHWDPLVSEKVELYAGILVGVRMQFYNYDSNYPAYLDTYEAHNNFAYPSWGAFAGARWYCAKNIGLYSELGYGNSFISFGVNFKF